MISQAAVPHESQASLKETVVGGVLWASTGSSGRQFLGFAVYAVLARLVGPEAFGLAALAAIYIAFVEVFVTQGFGTAIVQRKSLEQGHLDSAFWVTIAMATALTVTSHLLAGQVAILFGEPRLAAVVRWLSCSLLFGGFSAIPQALLTREMAFRALAVRSLLSTAIGGAVGLAMALGGFGVWSLVGQQLAGAAAGLAALWSATSWRPSLHCSRRHLRDLFQFAISIVGNNLLWIAAQRTDQGLIGLRFNAVALGPYALASRAIQLVVDAVSEPLQMVALPAFARLQDERERLHNAFYRSTEVAAAIAMPTFSGIVALAPSFVPLVFGPRWSAAVPLFQLMALYGLVRATLIFGHPLMLAIGRPGVYLLLFGSNVGLTLALCSLAVWWSPAAVAGALSLAMSVHGGIFLAVCRKLTGISIRAMAFRLSAPACVAAVMFVAVVAFRRLTQDGLGDLLTVTAGVALGAGIYVAGMLALRPGLVTDLSRIVLSRLAR